MGKTVTIYALVDPRTDGVRYIGATRKGVGQRCDEHVKGAIAATYGGGGRKMQWIQELAQLGLRPTVRALREVATYEAHSAERGAIQEYLDMGADLVNGTSLIPAGSKPPKLPRPRVITGKIDPAIYAHLEWQAYRAGMPLIDYVGHVLTDFIKAANGQ